VLRIHIGFRIQSFDTKKRKKKIQLKINKDVLIKYCNFLNLRPQMRTSSTSIHADPDPQHWHPGTSGSAALVNEERWVEKVTDAGHRYQNAARAGYLH